MREIFTGNISCISHNSANLQYYIHILYLADLLFTTISPGL